MPDIPDQALDLDFTRAPAMDDADDGPPAVLTEETLVGVGAFDAGGYQAAITRREASPRQFPGRRAVLIIDGDRSVSTILERYLGEEGYAMRCAGNRAQILQALQTPPLPDLILLEADIPDADGFDLLQTFQKSKVVGNIPVVMLTARAGRKDLVKGLTLGAAGYITKPATLAVIAAAVRDLLG